MCLFRSNNLILPMNFLFKLASDCINRQATQEYFDLANYTVEDKVGDVVVKDVQEILTKYFLKKQDAAIVGLLLFLLIAG